MSYNSFLLFASISYQLNNIYIMAKVPDALLYNILSSYEYHSFDLLISELACFELFVRLSIRVFRVF